MDERKGYNEFTLKNGLRVALQKTDNPGVYGFLRVHHGGFHEKEGEEGLSHLLEHCLVNCATEKYDTKTIEEMREDLGEFNATTGAEMTYLNAGALGEDFEKLIDVFSQMMFHSRFDGKTFEEQRGRVLREIEPIIYSPESKDRRAFREALYRGHPVDTKTEGKPEVIAACTIEQLRAIHQRGYGASNADLVIAGDLPNGAEKIIEKQFEDVPRGHSTRVEFPMLEPLDRQTFLHIPAAHRAGGWEESGLHAPIALGITGVPEMHPDNYAMRTLVQLLGRHGKKSRLHSRVSSKEGFTYDISASYDTGFNASAMIINTAVPARSWNEAVDAIFDEMKKIRSGELRAEEVERLKRNIQYSMTVSAGTNNAALTEVYERWKTGRTPGDFLKGYSAVTREDVIRVAQQHLPESREEGNYVLMVLDPLKSP